MKPVYLLCLSFLIGVKSFSQADSLLIQKHLTIITKTKLARNYKNVRELNYVANYIIEEFKKYADTSYFQTYEVEGVEYKNVVAVFGSKNKETLVVGAHYDVCQNQEGADDNASGTVALLELARLLKGQALKNRIEVVAYTLEEPPFFRTQYMGSYIHAQSLKRNKVPVIGMICLEMIAYFDESKHTQDYPIGALSLIYGTRGNYITLVNKFAKGWFSRKYSRGFKRSASIRTKKFTAPKALPGIDFSDHRNYWNFGYSAVMITDTSFYRNANYHEITDTMETLNITKMALVIDAVFKSIINFEV
jgi:hypothetical protein